MKSYSKAPDECSDRVKHLIKCFHSELSEVALRVDLISLTSDSEDGAPALTHQGYPAAAVIRVVDSKGRLMGRGDVEIVVDEAVYMELSDAEKDALLDHEIQHVELRVNKYGRVKLDEHGRPKCGMRKHDYQFGWFAEIAKRHGAAAMECKQARRLFIAEQQVFFFFVETVPTAKQLVEKIDDVLSSPAGPSAEVRRIARDITESSPAVQAMARDMVKRLRKDGLSMTMTSGGHSVTVGAEEKPVISTADGRQITATEMMGEIKERLAVEADKP